VSSAGFDYAHHWRLLQSRTPSSPARFAERGLRAKARGGADGSLAPGLDAPSSVAASLLELRTQTAAAGSRAVAAARGRGLAGDGVTSFADLSDEMFTRDAEGAASEGLQNAYGRVGPLGEDRASPHFRAQAPKLRAESADVSSLSANNFALSEGRLTASRYEYIGGYYGAGSESLMIRELQDGPIVVAFNSPGAYVMCCLCATAA
jgi:hypothetical protein